VRRRRKALDLTQDELASRAGCAVSMIRKIELDERRPSKQLAALLANALELPQAERDTFLRAARAELATDQRRRVGWEAGASSPWWRGRNRR